MTVKMEATTIIIAAVFTLQASTLFASNNESGNITNNEATNSILVTLAPTTPTEADFSDLVPESEFNFSHLAPVTPSDAEFNDIIPELNSTIDLSPKTPASADFEETFTDYFSTVSLKPVTPAKADFE